MGDRPISVAITPNGYVLFAGYGIPSNNSSSVDSRADAVTRGADNKLYFAEPLTEKMQMGPFLDTLSSG